MLMVLVEKPRSKGREEERESNPTRGRNGLVEEAENRNAMRIGIGFGFGCKKRRKVKGV